MASRMILLAEEDPATAGFLTDNLVADGYSVLVADDKTAALQLLETERPDLVLCDVNGDTLGLIDAVRGCDGLASRIAADTPLIVLTAHADELARVRYFDRGGDDVVGKPFSYSELRARIAAVLRRICERPTDRLRVGAITIDPASRQVRVGETPVELTRMEFALLRALAAEPTRVYTKHELLRDVWASAATPAPARSTATPAGCARSSARRATGAGSRTCGASATGSSASTAMRATGARHEARAAAAQHGRACGSGAFTL